MSIKPLVLLTRRGRPYRMGSMPEELGTIP
jgi:hypothetical protein